MKPSYPSRAWFEDGDNFRDWCTRLNLKFVAQAAHLVLGSDDKGPVPLTDALDQTIAQTIGPELTNWPSGTHKEVTSFYQ